MVNVSPKAIDSAALAAGDCASAEVARVAAAAPGRNRIEDVSIAWAPIGWVSVDAAADRLPDPQHQVELHGGAEGELARPGRGPGVAPRLAEQGDQQVGGTVDDRRLLGEARRRANEALHPLDRDDPVEVPDVLPDDREEVEHRVPGRLLRALEVHLRSDLAPEAAHPAGDEEEVAGALGAEVVGYRGLGRREGQAELPEAIIEAG